MACAQAFFGNVAKAKTVKTILQQCYGDKSAVTDELVRTICAMQHLEDRVVGVPLQALNRLLAS